MQIGDKVIVVKNPRNSNNPNSRNSRIERKGVIDSVSNNVIVIMYRNYGQDAYREAFNIGNIADGAVEILDKHHNKLTPQDFKEMIKNGKRII